jgi:hypothetical protein
MKIEKIIKIADAAYPDGMVQQAFDANKNRGVEDELVTVGDGLAEFIARELVDTYDPKASSDEQLTEAARCMTSARNEMDEIVMAFYKHKPTLFNA